MSHASARSNDSDTTGTVLSRAFDWLASRTASGPRRSTGVRDLAAAAGMTALDLMSAIRTQRRRVRPAPVTASVTIDRPPAEVYSFLRELSQLPQIMDHLVAVREVDAVWSHWVAQTPRGPIAWDVKIIEDLPGTLLEWRSVKGSVLALRGRASFHALREGEATELRIELALGAAINRRGRALARLFSAAQLAGDLRRLKQLLETRDDSAATGPAQPTVPLGPPRPRERAPGLAP
jgi:uncharacterized membrane protein